MLKLFNSDTLYAEINANNMVNFKVNNFSGSMQYAGSKWSSSKDLK